MRCSNYDIYCLKEGKLTEISGGWFIASDISKQTTQRTWPWHQLDKPHCSYWMKLRINKCCRIGVAGRHYAVKACGLTILLILLLRPSYPDRDNACCWSGYRPLEHGFCVVWFSCLAGLFVLLVVVTAAVPAGDLLLSSCYNLGRDVRKEGLLLRHGT